jgi:hypothetical protein
MDVPPSGELTRRWGRFLVEEIVTDGADPSLWGF